MVDKIVTGLLNGIAKRDYYDEPDVSDEFLKQQLFPELPQEDFDIILSKYQTILKNLVYSDMDLKQLEAYLTSQVKRKSDFLNESQLAAIMKFWKANKQKIHDVMIDRSSWSNQMKSMKWRIDISYKDNEQIGEPKAIFEIDVAKKTLSREKLFFEVDMNSLDEMVAQVEKIESKIDQMVK